MSDKNTEREYELKEHLRTLEIRREELDVRLKMIWQQEDDRDMEFMEDKRILEQMGSACASSDKVIVQLIEEKQQMMYGAKHKRIEFATEFEDEIRKKKQEIDYEMEDAQIELSFIRKQQEEEKEDSKTEETDGVE